MEIELPGNCALQRIRAGAYGDFETGFDLAQCGSVEARTQRTRGRRILFQAVNHCDGREAVE